MIWRVDEALERGFNFEDEYPNGLDVGDSIRGIDRNWKEIYVKIRSQEELEKIIAQRVERKRRLWGS